jgi:hypothetical protein
MNTKKKWYVCIQTADERSVWLTELTDAEYIGVKKFLTPNKDDVIYKDVYSGWGAISDVGYKTKDEAISNVFRY